MSATPSDSAPTSAPALWRVVDASKLRNTTRHTLVFNHGTPHETRLAPVPALCPRQRAGDRAASPVRVADAAASGLSREEAARAGVPAIECVERAYFAVDWSDDGAPLLRELRAYSSFVVDAAHVHLFGAIQRAGFWGCDVWIAEGALYNAAGVRCLEASGSDADADANADVSTLEKRVTRLVRCV